MRSRLSVLALALALGVGPARAAEAASAPTRAQVGAEMDKLRADPNLAGTEKQKTLRFKKDEREEKKKNVPTSLGAWLREFAIQVVAAGRVFMWLLAALLVALFIVGLRRWMQVRAIGGRITRGAALPSHVRDLDIRPESLPEQIGAAAAALWQRGEHRAALSLLYRGALSRLVHEHAVPIRAASTEGECVALAAARVAPERSAFFGRLVQAWQLAVYGARLPDSASVLVLCSDFDVQLRAAALPMEAAK